MAGKLRNFYRHVLRSEQGITGLETAIILIAFVVVATVFAFIVLTTGIFGAERGKETVYAGLQKTRGAIELRGGVVVQSTGCPTSCAVTQIQFQVANTAGGESVSLDPSATTNKTVIGYQTGTVVNTNMTYTVSFTGGNNDNALDPGEIATVTVTAASNANTIGDLTAGEKWSLIVESPTGATLDITRTNPAVLSKVMQLH